VHSIKKDLEDHKAKLTEAEVAAVEKAIEDIESAIKGNDVEAIAKTIADSYTICKPLNDKVAEAQQAASPETKTDDGVVDAVFTEGAAKDD
jgi:molecular chaperone DnaK